MWYVTSESMKTSLLIMQFIRAVYKNKPLGSFSGNVILNFTFWWNILIVKWVNDLNRVSHEMSEVDFFEYTVILHGYHEEDMNTFGSNKSELGGLEKLPFNIEPVFWFLWNFLWSFLGVLMVPWNQLCQGLPCPSRLHKGP